MNINLLKLNGRYYINNDSIQFFNVGSGVSFKVKCFFFNVDLGIDNEGGYIYLIIDRNYDSKKKIFIKDREKIEHKFDDFKEHYIDIIKANESSKNTLSIFDIKVNGDLLKYDFGYKKRIKAIGDSSIAGYGILEHSGVESIHNSDGVVHYCFKSLFNLDYDFDIFASSGWGAKFSIYTNPNKVGIVDKLQYVSTYSSIPWVDNSKCDCLVVSLGTNDQTMIYKNGKFSLFKFLEFANAYKHIISSQIKDKNTPIILIWNSLLEEQVYEVYERLFKYIKRYFKNVTILKLDGDNTGIDGHSYIDSHKQMSKQFTIQLTRILG